MVSSSSGLEVSWVQWFCSLKGHEYLLPVDEDYLQDKFNLTGLNEQVPHFRKALEIITDVEVDDDREKGGKRTAPELLEQAAELLYELIHARFIITPRGMHLMAAKYKKGDFGSCPRYMCQNQALLPVGLSDIPGEETVKNYCPRCRDIYVPRLNRHADLDGAYFGTGFPHMLFLALPELRPSPPTAKYVPKVYGFRIHPLAYKSQGQGGKTGGVQQQQQQPTTKQVKAVSTSSFECSKQQTTKASPRGYPNGHTFIPSRRH